jgi:hypothetical protein
MEATFVQTRAKGHALRRRSKWGNVALHYSCYLSGGQEGGHLKKRERVTFEEEKRK